MAERKAHILRNIETQFSAQRVLQGDSRQIKEFQRIILTHYRYYKRDLPWRNTTRPYRILVSEFMLQQTQVARVCERYRQFLSRFPGLRSLAEAPLAAVLQEWQGLGYNRRALFLHRAAQHILECHRGRVPRTVAQLKALPGIGEYTAAAVAVFAFSLDEVLIETNIRSLYTWFFYPGRTGIDDGQLLELIRATRIPNQSARWFSALMDAGVCVKQYAPGINSSSKHYVRQTAFRGSNREVRGALLRHISNNSDSHLSQMNIMRALPYSPSAIKKNLEALHAEGFLAGSKRGYRVAS